MTDFVLKDPDDSNRSCMIALVAETGGGKTYSGLEIILGASEVLGGLAVVISTAGGQAEHYKRLGAFKTIDFDSPHNLGRCQFAIDTALKAGATGILVDNITEVWDGLVEHQNKLASERDTKNADQQAWNVVRQWCKRFRREVMALIGGRALVVFTHWANVRTGGMRIPNNMYALADKDLLRHCDLKMLLMAGREPAGAPCWPQADEEGLFRCRDYLLPAVPGGVPIDKETGRALARWMQGQPCQRNGNGRDVI